MDGKDWSLFVIAKRQHGVVSYEQARAVGFTRTSMQWRLNTGEWSRTLPCVARLFWADETWLSQCWAARLWAGSGAVLTHHTAARLLGFDVSATDVVHVSVGSQTAVPPKKWVRPHRSLHRLDATVMGGLPVTTPARTALDLAGEVDEGEFERILRLALAERRVDLSSLRRVVAKPQRGVVGGTAMRRVLRRLVRE